MRRSATAGVFSLLAASFPIETVTAKAPPKDSSDWSEMQPYVQFIQVMGNCCSIADGRVPYKQEVTSDDGQGHRTYRVFMLERSFVTNDPADTDSLAYQQLFKNKGEYYQGKFGIWVDVPVNKVISEKDAQEKCAPIITKNKAERLADPSVPLHTCNPPIIGILWLSKAGNAYCYWPEQMMGAIDPKEFYKYGMRGTATAQLTKPMTAALPRLIAA